MNRLDLKIKNSKNKKKKGVGKQTIIKTYKSKRHHLKSIKNVCRVGLRLQNQSDITGHITHTDTHTNTRVHITCTIKKMMSNSNTNTNQDNLNWMAQVQANYKDRVVLENACSSIKQLVQVLNEFGKSCSWVYFVFNMNTNKTR